MSVDNRFVNALFIYLFCFSIRFDQAMVGFLDCLQQVLEKYKVTKQDHLIEAFAARNVLREFVRKLYAQQTNLVGRFVFPIVGNKLSNTYGFFPSKFSLQQYIILFRDSNIKCNPVAYSTQCYCRILLLMWLLFGPILIRSFYIPCASCRF